MNATMISPAGSVPRSVTQPDLLPLLLKMVVFAPIGVLVFLAQIVAIVLFPFGALAYGGFRLVRLAKNRLLR